MGGYAASVEDYIQAAPAAGRPLLRDLRALLRRAAPDARETIKWGTPFYVEPRFVFAFSAHKAHASFAPGDAAMAAFAEELAAHDATRRLLRLPYGAPLPDALLRRIAAYCVEHVAAREDDGFW